MSRKRYRRREAGFTLIEALVALAILVTVLSSVGMVITSTVKGTRAIDQRLNVSGVAETLLASLPARGTMKPGTQTGTMAGHRWRMDVVALQAGLDAPASRWTPVSIKLQVQLPGGPLVRVTTVRLVQTGS